MLGWWVEGASRTCSKYFDSLWPRQVPGLEDGNAVSLQAANEIVFRSSASLLGGCFGSCSGGTGRVRHTMTADISFSCAVERYCVGHDGLCRADRHWASCDVSGQASCRESP